ncbi:MAG: SMC-Scp complex subunit ScpB [Pirellulaceae bacterium]
MTEERSPESDDLDEFDEFHEEGVSLEELSRSYASVIGDYEAAHPTDMSDAVGDESELVLFDSDDEEAEAEDCPVTPTSILEAVLLVGRPDSGPITASEIASLMRGVTPAEVEQLVADLNANYEQNGSALRIVDSGGGFRLRLADDLKFITDRFYGRVREIRLSQAAIDCLALVSYQPGISRDELEKQRNQPSGGVLNQLVRRQLLEIRREGDGARNPCYYPTNRLLELTGLASLEDLPQVEEWQ